MATLSELYYSVMEAARANSLIDDTQLDERLVKWHLKNSIAYMVQQNLEKSGSSIDEDVIQDLGCVEFETADAADCCDFTSDCTVIRSKEKIPKPLRLKGGTQLITRVGPVNKSKRGYSFVPYNRALRLDHDEPVFKNIITSYYLNERVFLVGSTGNPALLADFHNIRGVFEDPEEVKKFNTCSGDPCYTDDSEYPINRWMIPLVIEPVIKLLLNDFRLPTDDKNDGEENLTINASKTR